MRKFVLTLMASLLSCSAAFAFWPEATDSSLEIGVGYRQDRLEWKTSSHFDSSDDSYCGCDDYGFPAGLSSHLKWRDLHIWQIEAKGKYVTCDNIYLRADGDYGWITDGKNTDSDFVSFNGDSYFCDDSFEFAHSKSKVKGHVYDARIAVGYQFKMCDDSFAIAPVLGWSWHGQHLEDSHLKQDCYLDNNTFAFNEDAIRACSPCSNASFSDYCDDSCSSYSGHHKNHSKYHTRWNGPFIGFDFDYRFGCGCEADWELFGGYEFHWASYHAKGDWFLRKDLFDGFHHRATDGYGHIFDIGIKWDFCECWTLALKGEFKWFWADRGHDRAKIAEACLGNVETACYIKTQLRDIEWHSAGVSVDLGMVF